MQYLVCCADFYVGVVLEKQRTIRITPALVYPHLGYATHSSLTGYFLRHIGLPIGESMVSISDKVTSSSPTPEVWKDWLTLERAEPKNNLSAHGNCLLSTGPHYLKKAIGLKTETEMEPCETNTSKKELLRSRKPHIICLLVCLFI